MTEELTNWPTDQLTTWQTLLRSCSRIANVWERKSIDICGLRFLPFLPFNLFFLTSMLLGKADPHISTRLDRATNRLLHFSCSSCQSGLLFRPVLRLSSPCFFSFKRPRISIWGSSRPSLWLLRLLKNTSHDEVPRHKMFSAKIYSKQWHDESLLDRACSCLFNNFD